MPYFVHGPGRYFLLLCMSIIESWYSSIIEQQSNPPVSNHQTCEDLVVAYANLTTGDLFLFGVKFYCMHFVNFSTRLPILC